MGSSGPSSTRTTLRWPVTGSGSPGRVTAAIRVRVVMMPSEKRNPSASSSSSPGVRIVIDTLLAAAPAACAEQSWISSGSSTATSSCFDVARSPSILLTSTARLLALMGAAATMGPWIIAPRPRAGRPRAALRGGGLPVARGELLAPARGARVRRGDGEAHGGEVARPPEAHGVALDVHAQAGQQRPRVGEAGGVGVPPVERHEDRAVGERVQRGEELRCRPGARGRQAAGLEAAEHVVQRLPAAGTLAELDVRHERE